MDTDFCGLYFNLFSTLKNEASHFFRFYMYYMYYDMSYTNQSFQDTYELIVAVHFGYTKYLNV